MIYNPASKEVWQLTTMEKFTQLIDHYLKCNNTEKLENNLSFIQEILTLMLNQIKNTNNFEEATLTFDVLGDIQFVLAQAVFKRKIVVTPQLNKFITDFDRIDDLDMKNFLYSKIKLNEYSLG